MNINQLGIVGGIFFILTFVHFFVDWIFQTHKEAMGKYHFTDIRIKHCLIYTAGFIPIFLLLKLNSSEICISLIILFLSHFIEDSYKPVYLWAKYIRKPLEMQMQGQNNETGFLKFAESNLGKILVITVDQIIHITFLIPIAFMAAN